MPGVGSELSTQRGSVIFIFFQELVALDLQCKFSCTSVHRVLFTVKSEVFQNKVVKKLSDRNISDKLSRDHKFLRRITFENWGGGQL